MSPSPLRWQTDINYDSTGKETFIHIYHPSPIRPLINTSDDENSFSDSDVNEYQIFFEDEPYSSSEDQQDESTLKEEKKTNN